MCVRVYIRNKKKTKGKKRNKKKKRNNMDFPEPYGFLVVIPSSTTTSDFTVDTKGSATLASIRQYYRNAAVVVYDARVQEPTDIPWADERCVKIVREPGASNIGAWAYMRDTRCFACGFLLPVGHVLGGHLPPAHKAPYFSMTEIQDDVYYTKGGCACMPWIALDNVSFDKNTDVVEWSHVVSVRNMFCNSDS
jgi:hypothetical protein